MGSMGFNDLMKIAEEAGGFKPIPEGHYTVKVVESKAGRSKDGSKDNINIQMEILSGPSAGKKAFNLFTLSPENPNAVVSFFKDMKTFGLDATFFSAEPPMEQVAAALVGKVVDINLVIDSSYDGTPRNKVKRILPANVINSAPQAAVDPFAQTAAAQPAAPPAAPPAAAFPVAPPF